MVIFIVVVCVVFGIIVYAVFTTGAFSGAGSSTGYEGVPRLRNLSPGCLITLIVAGATWFILWGIVLILVLRLLRTPLGS